MPAAKFFPVFPRMTALPPVIYSSPWSPQPSATAVAPEFRTQKRSPATPDIGLSGGRAVERDIADDDIFTPAERRPFRRGQRRAFRRRGPFRIRRSRLRSASASAPSERRRRRTVRRRPRIRPQRYPPAGCCRTAFGDLRAEDRSDRPVRARHRIEISSVPSIRSPASPRSFCCGLERGKKHRLVDRLLQMEVIRFSG
jgi:hypothetical protein